MYLALSAGQTSSSPGRVVDDLVDLSDMLPTICGATRTTIPPELLIDGDSFLPQIMGTSAQSRDAIYMWYSRDGSSAGARAFARNQRYKLYESGDFFDVLNDRLEKHPITTPLGGTARHTSQAATTHRSLLASSCHPAKTDRNRRQQLDALQLDALQLDALQNPVRALSGPVGFKATEPQSIELRSETTLPGTPSEASLDLVGHRSFRQSRRQITLPGPAKKRAILRLGILDRIGTTSEQAERARGGRWLTIKILAAAPRANDATEPKS